MAMNIAKNAHLDDNESGAPGPAFWEIGRHPLFAAESPFEHLAMVEKCLGKLPQHIYDVSSMNMLFPLL